jgi:hypothetical protein
MKAQRTSQESSSARTRAQSLACSSASERDDEVHVNGRKRPRLSIDCAQIGALRTMEVSGSPRVLSLCVLPYALFLACVAR